jgi:hypothetical protein
MDATVIHTSARGRRIPYGELVHHLKPQARHRAGGQRKQHPLVGSTTTGS